jgi:hypothetical protein
VLLTRLPLTPKGAFDLHVLGLPPAFVLSQDQTLKFERFILDTNHSELTERHTRRRFRPRGGLQPKTTPEGVSAHEPVSKPRPHPKASPPTNASRRSKPSDSRSLAIDCLPAVRKDPAAHVSLPSQHCQRTKFAPGRCADLPKQHDGTDPGASLLLFQEVFKDKAAATTASSRDLI